MSESKPLRQVIADSLSRAFTEAGDNRMILKHLTVIESLNDQGERVLSVFMSEDMRAWDIMGLADWAKGCAAITQSAELGRRE